MNCTKHSLNPTGSYCTCKIKSFFDDFFEGNPLPKGISSSFISLIHKIINPKEVKDFRPISLINCSLKLLTKVLTNRMRLVLDSIISQSQSAYVPGTQISDSIFIANEVVHGLNVGMMHGLIIKIDFEKAFDSISWEFLVQCMRRMNLGDKWIKWIQSILIFSRISILINGSPTKEFSPKRGIRQGDPLSPFLFLLVGEILNCMLTRASQLRIFSGIIINKSGFQVSHRQFAGDTILFIKNDLKSVMGVKQVLQCFEMLSGLKINFQKSKMFGFGEDVLNVPFWASRMGCGIGAFPITYLGMELGVNPKNMSFWKPIIDKMDRNLALWKSKLLNQAGKVVLLKSVINSTPNY